MARELTGSTLIGNPDTEVNGVVCDSRVVLPGTLFVAVEGLKFDGHLYLAQAAQLGAAAVVVQSDHEPTVRQTLVDLGLPALVVPNSRAALAITAAAVHGHPARSLGMIGVTGTDGKTSLCHLVDHIISRAGLICGLITTAECRIGTRHLLDTGRFTTPEAPELQAMLRDIADSGCQWAVVEATSHGLALNRLDGCEFDIAAVTVIGRDHLEFHGSLEAYVAAKGRLFEMLAESVDKGVAKTAVLNADDEWSSSLRRHARSAIVSYGLTESADVRAENLRVSAWGSLVRLVTPAGSIEVEVTRPGAFSVSNAMAASAVCLAAGVTLPDIAAGIASWPGAPGRLERIDEGQPFTVVVDFAHAPEALARVLDVLRDSCKGRVIAVFGCIGERERERRAGMGAVAAAKADYTMVTDDNPYSEDSARVIQEIVTGLEASGRRRGHDFEVVPDRRSAIAQALAMAVDGDVVLLAGKGHETFVHVGDGGYECDDRVVARRVLKELAGSRTAS
jgi:UDP-N-acetylmuramoyl-L-alanyl-D-glutamate--2,6-diaminopimelate ligase